MTRHRNTPLERKHLEFIRSLPCAVCGKCYGVDAAHISYADAAWTKPLTGTGAKADPWWVVPLCESHHREQHERGDERAWWASKGFDPDAPGLSPLGLCLDLWTASEVGDADMARETLRQHRFNIACGVDDREIPAPPSIAPPVKRRRGPGPRGGRLLQSRGFQKSNMDRGVDGRVRERT